MSEEEGKGKEGAGENEETVAKADLDAALARSEKLEQDLEDVRMEVLTPEYQRYLDDAEKGEEKPKQTTEEKVPDDAFEKMTKKEIFDLAVKTAKEEISGSFTRKEADAQKEGAAKTQREITSFAKEHADYETFRPIMYGLSLDPKNADMGLGALYQAAKDHVKNIHREPTKEEQEISRRSTNEKPGGDSSSLEKLKKMSNTEIAAEAMAEVEDELGPLPV